VDANEVAAKLAGQLTRRMTNLLSLDPEVTAQALWLYDPALCPKLVEALQAHMRSVEEAERADEEAMLSEENPAPPVGV
jgi:hypothetical protein